MESSKVVTGLFSWESTGTLDQRPLISGSRWVLRVISLSLSVFCIAGSGRADALIAPVPETEIVDRYLCAAEEQGLILRDGAMEVDIEAEVPKLQKQGKLIALRNISKLGKITYRMLGFSGDNTVKKEVIARYLSAEVQGQSGPDLSVTPRNYKFKLKNVQSMGGNLVYVLNVSPRKKREGLFKGELWLDARTYMPVRESGRFVKNPSIFLKKVEFVRIYEIQDGVSVPQRLESRVDTRLFGPVTLNINFGKFSKQPETERIVIASASETQ